MVEASLQDDEYKEDLLEKISALAKGLLIVMNESPEKSCSFCRGLLILLHQFQEIKPENA